MAEIDDVMRAAFGRAALAADAAVDLAAARQAVRGRIAAGEAGPRAEVAPGWRLVRWSFAAHRVAWTALIAAVAVAVAVLVIAGVRGSAPVAPGGPGTGTTTPAPVSEPGTSSTDAVATTPSMTAPMTTAASTTAPATAPITSAPATTAGTTVNDTTSTGTALATTTPPPRTQSSVTTRQSPPRTTAATRTSTAPTSVKPTYTTPTSATPTSATPTTKPPSTTTTPPTTTRPEADTDPPVILTLFATAQEVAPGQTVSIVAQVTDNVAVAGVRLTWSGKEDGLPAGAAEMTPSQTGWVLTVTVPKLDRGGAVVFTATARDAAGNRSERATVAVVIQL